MRGGLGLSLPELALLARNAATFDLSGSALPRGATLARASTGWRINGAGALEAVAADGARFDHDPTTLARRGLLVEAARTNLFLQSQDLRSSWAFGGAVASAANRLTEDSSAGAHNARQNFAYTIGQPGCLSVTAWELAGSAKRYLSLRMFFSALGATFDLASGAVVAEAGVTATITPWGSTGGVPMWRCSVSAVAPASATGSQIVRIANAFNAAAPNYAGNGSAGLGITDMQFEVTAAPGSNVPTTTSPVTRAADVLTLDWASRGVADGTAMLRYTFDDGSTQDVATTIAGGTATVPTTLNRAWIRRIARV